MLFRSYLSIIAEGLDSISIEEKELLVNNTPGENMGFNRQRIKQNLDHIREILARHRNRIEGLEKKLNTANGDTKHLRTIISALREQIESKDRELVRLRADLEDNRKSIAMLTSQVQQINKEKDVHFFFVACAATEQEHQGKTDKNQNDFFHLSFLFFRDRFDRKRRLVKDIVHHIEIIEIHEVGSPHDIRLIHQAKMNHRNVILFFHFKILLSIRIL